MTKVLLAFLDYFLDDDESSLETAAPISPLNQRNISNSVLDFRSEKGNSLGTKTAPNKWKGARKAHSFSRDAPKSLCKVCNKTFDDDFFLRVHEYEHEDEFKNKKKSNPRLKKTQTSCVCEFCNEAFDNEFLLRVHCFEHVDLSSALPAASAEPQKKTSDFVCNICLETFDDAFFLRIHSYEHVDVHKLIEPPESPPTQSSTNNVCDVCGTEFEDALSLRVHAFEHKERHFCAICRAGFPSISDLKSHYRGHSKLELWKKRFKLPKNIAEPIKEKYDEACSEKFINDPPKPKKYPPRKWKRKTGKCETCGAIRGLYALKEHRKMHEGVKRHSCQLCGKKFLRVSDAKKHFYLMHAERTRPSCEICGKVVSNASNMRLHLMRHSNDKRFPCEMCGRRFLCKFELRRHYLVHTGEKPYVCDICGVAMKKGYRRHMLTHGVEVEYCRSVPTNYPPK